MDEISDVPPENGSDEEPGRSKRLGPGAKLKDAELQRRMAALLFASPEPLSVARLVQLLERPRSEQVKSGLEAIGKRISKSGLPLELRAIAGGWTLMTAPEMGEIVARLSKARANERVSPAALETLAVIAYRQPVTKAEIEAIRGVQAGPLLRTLVDRGLVRVLGRSEEPGHPAPVRHHEGLPRSVRSDGHRGFAARFVVV